MMSTMLIFMIIMLVLGWIIGGIGSLFDVHGLSILGACFCIISGLCFFSLIIFGVLSNFTINWENIGGVSLCFIIIGFFALLRKYF